jgi:hypothetical protein
VVLRNIAERTHWFCSASVISAAVKGSLFLQLPCTIPQAVIDIFGWRKFADEWPCLQRNILRAFDQAGGSDGKPNGSLCIRSSIGLVSWAAVLNSGLTFGRSAVIEGSITGGKGKQYYEYCAPDGECISELVFRSDFQQAIDDFQKAIHVHRL